MAGSNCWVADIILPDLKMWLHKTAFCLRLGFSGSLCHSLQW